MYPARGQVQAKSVLAADPSVQLGSLHARVVCIANLGPSTVANDFGGIDGNHVWELRIRVTKASPFLSVGDYGSIFVQDNGRGSGVDFADENFDLTALGDPTCGVTTGFQLEPVLQGSIEVHD